MARTYNFNIANRTANAQQQQPQTEVNSKFRIYTVKGYEPKIDLDEISLPQTKPNSETQNIEDVVSIEYPLIKINDYILARNEILSMEIDSTDFLPRIVLAVTFFNDVFVSREMPKDGDMISLAIRNKSDVLNIIRNDYVITGVIVNPKPTNTKEATRMTFYGELFIPGLRSQKNDMSFEGTSMEAIKDFCKQTGLGFATNENNTNDKQIWLKANTSGILYLQDTIKRAWKDEQSFFDAWIDIYYTLNFVNINSQLLSAESEIDTAALIHNLDTGQTYGNDTTDAQTKQFPKVFSNYIQYRTSSFYIVSWNPVNRSSMITFQIGTKMTCEMFVHNVNLYADSSKQKYWALDMEPIYDPQKLDKYIILRGRTMYDSSINDKDLAKANYSYRDIYEKYPWLGIQYTISNPNDDNLKWDGNHHKNYMRARVQNLINTKELDKLNLEISVTGNNFNIIRGDKVPVILIKKDAVENMQINIKAESNDMLDMFYSGWYIVNGFKVRWDGDAYNNNSIMSNFSQEFVLTRREWPPPIYAVKVDTKNNNP